MFLQKVLSLGSDYFSVKFYQSIPPLPKHIFVIFLPSHEKQINSLLLVSVGDTEVRSIYTDSATISFNRQQNGKITPKSCLSWNFMLIPSVCNTRYVIPKGINWFCVQTSKGWPIYFNLTADWIMWHQWSTRTVSNVNKELSKASQHKTGWINASQAARFV